MQSLYTITQNNSNSYLNSTTNNKYVLSTDVGILADAVQSVTENRCRLHQFQIEQLSANFHYELQNKLRSPEFC